MTSHTLYPPIRPASSRKPNGGLLGCLALVLVAALAVCGIGAWIGYAEYGTQTTVTFTVTGLDDQITSSSGSISHQYLVSTVRDAGMKTEVFKDTDSILHGKTDSSDVWARFQAAGKGAIWTCPVYGFRIFWSSSYRNILDGCKLLHSGTDSGISPPNLYPTPNGKPPASQQFFYAGR